MRRLPLHGHRAESRGLRPHVLQVLPGPVDVPEQDLSHVLGRTEDRQLPQGRRQDVRHQQHRGEGDRRHATGSEGEEEEVGGGATGRGDVRQEEEAGARGMLTARLKF